MAATPSNMVALGTPAPNFSLYDAVGGRTLSLSDCKSDIATVIMFICNHCPFVKHINPVLSKIAEEYTAKGVRFVGINSNDVKNYPEDSPDKMRETARKEGYVFPYLFDETQQTAKDYNAACTPDFFIYDKNLKLVYRGQFDSSRPGNNFPVTGMDLSAALDSIIDGKTPDLEQKPSIGCNIKWKKL